MYGGMYISETLEKVRLSRALGSEIPIEVYREIYD